MKNKYPPEAADGEWMIKRGTSGRKDPGFKLVEDFVPTRRDLEALARDYLEDMRDYKYGQMVHKTFDVDRGRDWELAFRRLDSIEQILGKKVLRRVLAPVKEKWRKMFDDVKVELAIPMDCEECGEEFFRDFLQQILCKGCLEFALMTEWGWTWHLPEASQDLPGLQESNDSGPQSPRVSEECDGKMSIRKECINPRAKIFFDFGETPRDDRTPSGSQE